MIEGILWAIGAGVMLGLYALPEKYVKNFKYENTWGLFFVLALVVLPIIAAFTLIDNYCAIIGSLDSTIILYMALLSILWGLGVQLWSKAIDYIGMSLGFSIFIGAVIMVGSILPFIVDGLPSSNALVSIIIGLGIILVGIMLNGFAGVLRNKSTESSASKESKDESKKVITGIGIALFGGLMATGFSLANAVGIKPITEAVVANGNADWTSSIVVMTIIYLSGALYVIPFFIAQLCKNKSWSNFTVKSLKSNFGLILIMAIFNFAASIVFAYAAFNLGSAGNSVGYAVYNTTSVLLAVLGGLFAKEWVNAPKKASLMLYIALACMVGGVTLIAIGNSVNM